MDFIPNKLSLLLKRLKESNYWFVTLSDYLTKGGEKVVILRHDIDKSPKSALRIAKIENNLNIKDHTTLDASVAPTIIREGAFLAIRITILPGAEVGKYTIISAGTVIARKTGEKVILSGNPPRKIGEVEL